MAVMGNGNTSTGILREDRSYFADNDTRSSELIVEDHASISSQHRLDCSDRITLGPFSTLAGWNSQVLTHSINLESSRQECAPVTIGAYSFVGTQSVLLAGTSLPARSVLGAGSVLQRAYEEEFFLYAGVPAKPVKALSQDMKYFHREIGPVS